MKVYGFFWIKALVSAVFAVLMIFLPTLSPSWFGIEVSRYGSLMVQMAGALFAGIALICLFSSNSESSLAVRNTMFALAIADTLGLIVSLMGYLNGLMNSLGILVIVLWAFFAVAAWIYWVVGGRTV
ncbi:hypothetical protein [Marispirochaeta aestuarii]|uniref:Uncharacterized protein n=1 Tax=Marispirochaeta aestuarii TaxID=1963862 RepID=A0A1Y1RYN0_9SPIO|nr:hypothetical protein [Marispirochaeta aestuarii]ORC35673.1 hypothetical protein B4O97_08495 [Marispirochaeta aestuarii]